MPLHDYTRIYKTSHMLMDIIFQVLTTVNNHLINIFREDKSTQKKKKKKCQLAFETQD